MVRSTIGFAIIIMMLTDMSKAAAKPPVSSKKHSSQSTKVDIYSEQQLAQMTVMSTILSHNTAALSSKLAIAMAGQGSDFVLGHGSGGMGFRGTGTGGGGTDGFSRINGLGKVDTGNGGSRGLTSKEKSRRVAKLKLGTPTFSGQVTKAGIARTLKRPATGKCQCDCTTQRK